MWLLHKKDLYLSFYTVISSHYFSFSLVHCNVKSQLTVSFPLKSFDNKLPLLSLIPTYLRSHQNRQPVWFLIPTNCCSLASKILPPLDKQLRMGFVCRLFGKIQTPSFFLGWSSLFSFSLFLLSIFQSTKMFLCSEILWVYMRTIILL